MSFRSVSILLFISYTSIALSNSNKVIYGNDDRYNMNDYHESDITELAKATAAMIPNEDIIFSQEADQYILTDMQLKDTRDFCPEVKHLEQNALATCSGFLISPKILVTAGHCMTAYKTCSRVKWAFGYNHKNLVNADHMLQREEVYTCKLLDYVLDNLTGKDYAVLELNKEVQGVKPLKVRTSGQAKLNDPLFVIGHPTGLPTKIADNALIRNDESPVFFSTNLDTFGGNSGSAVFNRDTKLVEGILVRGAEDFVLDIKRNCYINNTCTDDGCKGEEVTRINVIKDLNKYIK